MWRFEVCQVRARKLEQIALIGACADGRELLEFARANLAHFKAPHSVTFVKELPKTATGKIQKYILRAQRPAIAPQ